MLFVVKHVSAGVRLKHVSAVLSIGRGAFSPERGLITYLTLNRERLPLKKLEHFTQCFDRADDRS